ncbi:MAG: chromosomal replication initiator protein DnaA [Alicyclobacillaceae bacterium]|nr:chromosomal replication initiator protein DnaA [Alicyclobacillaceae bacterium]
MITTRADTASFDPLWADTLRIMRNRMDPSTFDTWFRDTRVVRYSPNSRVIVIGVPSEFVRDWMRQHYSETLQGIFQHLTGESFTIEFEADPPEHGRQTVAPETFSHPGAPSQLSSHSDAQSVEAKMAPDTLIARYTFETFVIGAGNRFTHAACLAVAERPGERYNPLFIYGGVGLGKTHLMHAIGHRVRQQRPHLRVGYVTTERFVNEFITAIRDYTTDDFRNRYRSIDVLLIDDIQFIAKKEQTQEEFFHTFNALHEAGKQIVITSDRPPRDIPTLEDRLRSRFEWGLLTDIQPPDFETRVAIVQRKAKADGISIPDEVAEYIANQVDTNIRELEGALIRVIAYSSLVNADITVELAQQALKDIISPARPRAITIQQIQKVIGEHFGLRVEELKAKKRTKDVAFPRQLAMYLARELTDLSLPRIGAAFGRDHTTVLHACEKIAKELTRDTELQLTVRRLTEAIRTLT